MAIAGMTWDEWLASRLPLYGDRPEQDAAEKLPPRVEERLAAAWIELKGPCTWGGTLEAGDYGPVEPAWQDGSASDDAFATRFVWELGDATMWEPVRSALLGWFFWSGFAAALDANDSHGGWDSLDMHPRPSVN